MASILSLLFNILINGVLFSLLSILAESLLIVSGLTRGNKVGIVIIAFSLAMFKVLLDYDPPLYVYGVILFVIGPLSVNRADLTTMLRLGRWWWKSQNENQHPET